MRETPLVRNWATLCCVVSLLARVGPGSATRADAGESSPATRPGGGAAAGEPSRRTVMGVETEAQSVVFVCDASASMDAAFADVRRELAAAVESLGPEHSFSLLF